MPTDKPRITFMVEEEFDKMIDEYRFTHRMKNKSQAILALLEKGLSAVEGSTVPDKDVLSDEEHKLIDMYRSLDEHGKQALYAIMNVELQRVRQPRIRPIRSNAHAGSSMPTMEDIEHSDLQAASSIHGNFAQMDGVDLPDDPA